MADNKISLCNKPFLHPDIWERFFICRNKMKSRPSWGVGTSPDEFLTLRDRTAEMNYDKGKAISEQSPAALPAVGCRARGEKEHEQVKRINVDVENDVYYYRNQISNHYSFYFISCLNILLIFYNFCSLIVLPHFLWKISVKYFFINFQFDSWKFFKISFSILKNSTSDL